MDRLIYTSASSAQSLLERQAMVANNLANASTPGFRADTVAYRAIEVGDSDVPQTRAFAAESTAGVDFRPGPVQQTGNPFDVAIQGKGWMSVQAADGSEAYTRGGSLQIGPDGTLQTSNGHPLLGDGGPITVPPDSRVTIGRDGTVSAIPLAPPMNNVAVLGRIKLVNPPESELTKGKDGMFRLRSGDPAPTDDKVQLLGGAIEGSNVNPAEAMVDLIASARQYEMHMKMVQSAQDDDRGANQLLSLS